MRLVVLFFSAVLFLMQTACITTSYHDSMKSVNCEEKEFEDFTGKYKLYEGIYSGENITVKGNRFYEVQFKDVLAGEGRFLNLLIPVQNGYEALIFESASVLKGERKAYLAVENFCCMEDYREIFDPSLSGAIEKDPEKMKKVLKKYYPQIRAGNEGAMFIKLTFSNVKYFTLAYKIWSPAALNGEHISSGYLINKEYSNMDLKWVKRSRVKGVFVKGGYIFTVVADIVTSPVQLIGAIIYFAMGGAAK